MILFLGKNAFCFVGKKNILNFRIVIKLKGTLILGLNKKDIIIRTKDEDNK